MSYIGMLFQFAVPYITLSADRLHCYQSRHVRYGLKLPNAVPLAVLCICDGKKSYDT